MQTGPVLARRQKIFAVDRAHIVPEQIHGHPPRKRKKPDKEQTSQSAPYPAAVSLNSSPSSERGCYARRKMDCQAMQVKKPCPAHTHKIRTYLSTLGRIHQEITGSQVHTGRSPNLPRLHRKIRIHDILLVSFQPLKPHDLFSTNDMFPPEVIILIYLRIEKLDRL